MKRLVRGEAWARVGEIMPYYRLYFVEGYSGHIDHFREFEASTDAEALVQCEAWRETCAMELWNGARKVGRWEAAGAASGEPAGAEKD